MRTLDLVVLADRHCSTSKTYVHYLYQQGFRVRKILLMDFGRTTLFYDGFKNCLPFSWMESISSFFAQKSPPFSKRFQELCDFFQQFVPHPIDYSKDFPFERYTQKVSHVCGKDINDPFIQRVLNNQKIQTFLYTNGGIVSKDILEVEGRRIFHVHPGVVPYVKGSDGLLWSFLIRGKLGASCFYMNSGIDTGDIIQTKEWDLSIFQGYQGQPFPQETIYRALLYSFDPHLRAQLFADVMEKLYPNLQSAMTKKQRPTEGRTYYVMHPTIVSYAFKKMGLSSMIHSSKK